jgi:hypothetical protein
VGTLVSNLEATGGLSKRIAKIAFILVLSVAGVLAITFLIVELMMLFGYYFFVCDGCGDGLME